MRIWTAVCGLLVAASGLGLAQSENARSAAEEARNYGTAVRSCDMRWVLEAMYPPLRNTYAEMLVNRENPSAEGDLPTGLWTTVRNAGFCVIVR